MSANSSDYLAFAAIRCAIPFPIEHPLEVAKLKSQGQPSLSPQQVVRTIYQENGLKAFYDGCVSNVAKRTVRVAYRWPTVGALHSYWNRILEDRGMVTHLATAGSIAGIETACVLPLERLFVSKVNALGYSHFINNQFKYEGVKSLYHGAAATFTNHLTSWTTFMMTNHIAKKMLRQIDPKGEYPILGKCASTVAIAASLTAVDLPLEFIKLQTQMHPHLQKMSLREVAKTLFKQYGLKGFYAGRSFAFVHKGLQTLFGSAFFDQMTKSS